MPSLVAEELHKKNGGSGDWASLNKEKKKSKQDRAKQRLNLEGVSKMNAARITERDKNAEIRLWLLTIDSMVKK